MPSLRQIRGWAAQEHAERERQVAFDAEVKRLEGFRRSGVTELAKENAKLAAELADAEWNATYARRHRDLVLKSSPEFESVAPQYAPVAGDTADKITARCQKVWNEFQSMDTGSIPKKYVALFLQQNRCDISRIDTHVAAVQFIQAQLTRPTPEPQPEQEREANGRWVAKPEVNPHPADDHPNSAYQQWDAAKAKRDAESEMTPVFREAVRSLCELPDGGRMEMPSESQRELFQKFSNSRLPFTVANIRRIAISIWPTQVVLTPEERQQRGIRG